ncbi:hypothetical protein [Endozoicomonas arenosclerae]|uniref:hypothetical protein n=1 Tax=Endozoicomonas arenosclerae TaxID=1633495 RepID=UPI00078675B7|nr:hypothetical protein [Endozoicomonas arenosclerae]
MTDNDKASEAGGQAHPANQKRFTGVWIPAFLYEYEALSSADRETLAIIKTLSESGKGFVSVSYVAEVRNVAREQQSRLVTKLEQLGLVERLSRGKGRPQQIRLVNSPDDGEHDKLTSRQNDHTPCDENITPTCDESITPTCDESITPTCDESITPPCDENITPPCDENITPPVMKTSHDNKEIIKDNNKRDNKECAANAAPEYAGVPEGTTHIKNTRLNEFIECWRMVAESGRWSVKIAHTENHTIEYFGPAIQKRLSALLADCEPKQLIMAMDKAVKQAITMTHWDIEHPEHAFGIAWHLDVLDGDNAHSCQQRVESVSEVLPRPTLKEELRARQRLLTPSQNQVTPDQLASLVKRKRQEIGIGAHEKSET